jgi:hypothetical protein
VKRKFGVSGKAARTAAYLVARAIGRRGLRPRRVLVRNILRIEAMHTRSVAKALDDELNRNGTIE